MIGPLVQGYFSVVTEIFDDTGRPHTLEHLIFMGSEACVILYRLAGSS